MTRITEDAWIAEMQRLSQKKDKGLTAGEWSERLKVNYHTALLYIKKAQKLGWLRLGWRSEPNLIGRAIKRPVYWIERPKR